jgi:hypothetical protein
MARGLDHRRFASPRPARESPDNPFDHQEQKRRMRRTVATRSLGRHDRETAGRGR